MAQLDEYENIESKSKEMQFIVNFIEWLKNNHNIRLMKPATIIITSNRHQPLNVDYSSVVLDKLIFEYLGIENKTTCEQLDELKKRY